MKNLLIIEATDSEPYGDRGTKHAVSNADYVLKECDGYFEVAKSRDGRFWPGDRLVIQAIP